MDSPARNPDELFIGRDTELDALRHGLAEALSGRSRVLLLAGEPGIGKTTTAEQFVRSVREAGVCVIWAKCYEQAGAPAFWPWELVFRALLVDPEFAPLWPLLEPVALEMAAGAAPGGAAPEHARFRLFDGATTGIKQVAQVRPLVLVIDDLHGADVSSLLLLQFLAQHLEAARVLVLGTYRDMGLPAEHPIMRTLAELARIPGNRALFLAGLDPPAIGRFIRESAGSDPSSALIEAVRRETDGNPFLVSELVRQLVDDGHIDRPEALERVPVSQRVRAATGRRLAGLSPECQRAIVVASVIGREFTLGLVAAAGGADDDVTAVVDEATAAGLVSASPGRSGHWRFDHALTREAVYADVKAGERARLHQTVGEGIERLHAGELGSHLAELAHHFAEASRTGDPAKAIAYARRAGDHACAASAYEEAVRLYESALEMLPRQVGATPMDRCDLVLALAAAHHGAGDVAQANRASLEAASLARASGTREQLARAALSYGTRDPHGGAATADPTLVGLLEEALAAWQGQDDPLHATLLGRLAGILAREDDPARRDRLSAEALAMARRIGDLRLLGRTLSNRLAATIDDVEQSDGLIAELFRIATETRDTDLLLQSHRWGFIDCLTRGDGPGVIRALHGCRVIAEASRDPVHRWFVAVLQITQATLEGRFSDAERLMGELANLTWCQPFTGGLLVIETFSLRSLTGGLEGIVDAIESTASLNEAAPSVRACVAMVHAELGQLEKARREYDRVLARDLADVPFPQLLMTIEFLARVCEALGDVEHASTLYDRMLPNAALTIVVGPGVAMYGTADHVLGRLAGVRGDWAVAARHLDTAIEQYASMKAAPWLAEARYDRARVLMAADGDRVGAMALNDLALASARELGMQPLERKASALHARLERHEPSDVDVVEARLVADNVMRREGDYWTLIYEGTTSRLRHSSGCQYLAELLRHPGREIHALELVSLAREEPADLAEVSGDAGEVLDAQARASYRQRLLDLRAARAEAEANNDAGRCELLQHEREALESELARAVGLGNRARRAASAAERARINVTRAVRRVVGRCDDANPTLGRHLARRLRTGAFCVYLPDPRVDVRWVIGV